MLIEGEADFLHRRKPLSRINLSQSFIPLTRFSSTLHVDTLLGNYSHVVTFMENPELSFPFTGMLDSFHFRLRLSWYKYVEHARLFRLSLYLLCCTHCNAKMVTMYMVHTTVMNIFLPECLPDFAGTSSIM